MNTEFCRGSGS